MKYASTKTCFFPLKQISFTNSIRVIRGFISTKKAEYITNGQQVVEELKSLIRSEILPTRKLNRHYVRNTAKCRKYK